MNTLDILILVLGAIASFGIAMYFRDRDRQREHESALSVEILAATRQLNVLFEELDSHTRVSLDNFKITLVAVLKDMREVVKNTETERQRTAGVAAATLLRPGKRLPNP